MSTDTTTVDYRPAAAPAAGTNGMAVASLVLGIVWLGGLGSVLAIIFGAIARKQVRQTGQSGSGLATAGLVLGILGVIGALLWIVLIVAAAGGAASAADAYSQCIDAAQTVAEMSNC